MACLRAMSPHCFVARVEASVAAISGLYVLGAQRRLTSADLPTCEIVTSVCDSASCANPMQLQHATLVATEQFGNAIRASHIGEMGSGWLHAASEAHMPHSVLDEHNALVFGSIGEGSHTPYLAIFAWGALLAITLVLASLLQAVATTALVVPEEAVLRTAHLDDDPASGWVDTRYATPESCSVPAADGKDCIS